MSKGVLIGAPISEAMNQRRIAVESEYHRLVGGEDGVEIAIGESFLSHRLRIRKGGIRNAPKSCPTFHWV
jgi:hypothetical protein